MFTLGRGYGDYVTISLELFKALTDAQPNLYVLPLADREEV